jgi:thermostable 8-oxoguanine DNA glycosylase
MGDIEDYRQYFKVESGTLTFCKKPISRHIIEETKRVLKLHVAPDLSARSLYEALIFCIASQRVRFERSVSLVMRTHGATLEQLTDNAFLEDVRKEAGAPCKGRFKESLDYMQHYPGGIEAVARDYLKNPRDMRRTLVKEVKWLAAKTASFWYLCMGGTKLMTMDVHNYRQMAGAGVAIDKRYFVGQRRTTDDRPITTTPGLSKYEQIEQDVFARFQDCPTAQNGQGVDGAFVTGLFWTVGAAAHRGDDPHQSRCIDVPVRLAFATPYSKNADPKRVKEFLHEYAIRKRWENPRNYVPPKTEGQSELHF